MEGNDMKSEDGQREKHQDGPPWKTVAKYATYEEADQKRLELAMEKDMQVKVHWQGKASSRYFAVKSRLDPAVVALTNNKRTKKGKRGIKR